MRITLSQRTFRRRRLRTRTRPPDRIISRIVCSNCVERLEQRYCLATSAITAVFPAANEQSAAQDAQIEVTVDNDILADSLSDQTLVVQSERNGRIPVQLNELTVDANRLLWTPAEPFAHGDKIQVTAGVGLRTRQGASVAPALWEFQVATNSGAVLFNRDKSTLAGDVADLKLGDIDGDDDLDMIVQVAQKSPHRSELLILQNDGHGNFRELGSPIAGNTSAHLDLADIDNDGDLDVLTGDRKTIRVLRNDSTGRFTETFLPITDANEIAIGDLNQDGHMDIFVAAELASQVWLQSEQSPGRFEYVVQDFTAASRDARLGDLDHDGDLDALIFGRDDSQVWLNDGTGRFHDSGQRLDAADQVELGDLDGDGDLDIYTDSAQTWFNNNQRLGVFEQPLGQASLPAIDVALGDIDGDGDLDSVIGAGDGNVIARNDGSGLLRADRDESEKRGKLVVAIGDVDGDGDLDVIRAAQLRSSNRQSVLTIFRNADVAADLALDIRAAQSHAFPGSNVRYTIRASNEGPRLAERALISLQTPASLHDVQVTCRSDAEVNCSPARDDGIRDLIRLPPQTEVIYTITARVDSRATGTLEVHGGIADPAGRVDVGLENNADSEHIAVTRRTVLPKANTIIDESTTFSAAFTSPIDRSTLSSRAFILHGSQSGNLTSPQQTLSGDEQSIRFTPNLGLFPGETVQVSMPGQVRWQDDQAELGTYTQQYRVSTSGGTGLFRDSSLPFSSRSTVLFDSREVVTGDLDQDGDLDLITAGGPTAIYYNDGQGQFELFQSLADQADSAAIGDLDGDGDMDIVFAEDEGISRVWINRQGRRFEPSPAPAFEHGDISSIDLADMDGDGDLDLLSIGDQTTLLTNDGSANFSVATLFGGEGSPFVADFNSDGRIDLLLSNQLWKNIGDGQYSRSLLDTGASDVGDLDGDGDVDVIGSGNILINDGLGHFQSHQVPDSYGYDSRLGDVDGDNDLDVVAGNGVWINMGQLEFAPLDRSFSRTMVRRPVLGDFDGDGDLDVMADHRGFGFKLWINANLPSDLSVELPASQTFIMPGQAIQFDVVVRNDGPQDALGVRLQDEFPSEFVDARWQCEATAGSTCSASGRGDILDNLNLLEGGVATYTVDAMLADEASGSIRNVAAISMGADGGLADFDPNNDTMTGVIIVPEFHVTPARNSYGVDQNPEFTLVFDDATQIEGLSPDDITVHGFLSGNIGISNFSTEEATVTFQLDRDLKAGERFEVAVHPPSAGRNELSEARVIAGRAGTEQALAHFVPVAELPEHLDEAVAGDFDGDNDVDLILVGSRQLGLQLNDGFGNFSESANWLEQSLELGSHVTGISAADVDQDGDLDVLVGEANVRENGQDDSETTGTFLLRNDGQGQFTVQREPLSTRGWRNKSSLSDLDGDGDVDAILFDRDQTSILLNDGTGHFTDTGQVLPGAVDRHDYRTRLSIGDVDGDDDMDLAYRGQVFLNDGTATFIASQDLVTRQPTELGDVDGDGDLDLIAAGYLWWNDGVGDFRPSNVIQSFDVNLGDVDGDGDLDAVSSELWINDGRGRFRRSGQRIGSRILALADLDGDRQLDVVTNSAILFNKPVIGDVNADGVFSALDVVQLLQAGRYLEQPGPGPLVRYEEGDFNQDGRFDQLDLIFALQSGSFDQEGPDG